MSKLIKMFIVLSVGVFYLCGNALGAGFTIDKNTWKAVSPDEKIFGYFYGPAYYLLHQSGDSVILHFDKRDPILSDYFRNTITLYLESSSAANMKKLLEQQKGQNTVLKQVPMSVIFAQQYKTVGTPIKDNPTAPDFIVFLTNSDKIVTVEFLMSPDKTSVFTVASGNRKYSPAFLFRADAIKYQDKLLKETGQKFDRIELDIDTFVNKFMRPNSKTDIPFAVFGENAENLIPAFEKQYR